MPTQKKSASFSQKIVASDGSARDWFGSWVAISGTTAFVSAKNAAVGGMPSRGAVYVFTKSGAGWKQTQKLVASDGAPGDQFGTVVAISDKLAVITAPFASVNANRWQGAAYVFSLVANKWMQVRRFNAKAGYAFETFGVSIAVNPTSVFIGAGGASSVGHYIPRRVYVFEPGKPGAGQSWTEKQIIESFVPEDPTSSFGASMAAADDVLLIGARANEINGNIGQGSVFVYTKTNGTWLPTAELTANDAAARDNFGVSVAMQGLTALVGAQGATINGNVSQGAVYRFKRTGLDWTQTQKFAATDGTAINLFGSSMSLSGDSLIVGAYAANSYRGAAYNFYPQADGNWMQSQKLTASDASTGGVFGYTTAVDNTTALVGSFNANVGNKAEQGAAYIFDLPPPPIDAKAATKATAKKEATAKTKAAADTKATTKTPAKTKAVATAKVVKKT